LKLVLASRSLGALHPTLPGAPTLFKSVWSVSRREIPEVEVLDDDDDDDDEDDIYLAIEEMAPLLAALLATERRALVPGRETTKELTWWLIAMTRFAQRAIFENIFFLLR